MIWAAESADTAYSGAVGAGHVLLCLAAAEATTLFSTAPELWPSSEIPGAHGATTVLLVTSVPVVPLTAIPPCRGVVTTFVVTVTRAAPGSTRTPYAYPSPTQFRDTVTSEDSPSTLTAVPVPEADSTGRSNDSRSRVTPSEPVTATPFPSS